MMTISSLHVIGMRREIIATCLGAHMYLHWGQVPNRWAKDSTDLAHGTPNLIHVPLRQSLGGCDSGSYQNLL